MQLNLVFILIACHPIQIIIVDLISQSQHWIQCQYVDYDLLHLQLRKHMSLHIGPLKYISNSAFHYYSHLLFKSDHNRTQVRCDESFQNKITFSYHFEMHLCLYLISSYHKPLSKWIFVEPLCIKSTCWSQVHSMERGQVGKYRTNCNKTNFMKNVDFHAMYSFIVLSQDIGILYLLHIMVLPWQCVVIPSWTDVSLCE